MTKTLECGIFRLRAQGCFVNAGADDSNLELHNHRYGGEEMQQSHNVNFSASVIEKLKDQLPVVFARSAIKSLLGGAVSPGTLANLGREGPEYFIVNKRAVYERDSFLKWLATRIKNN